MHDETNDRWPRLTRRGFLAGTVAAALAACGDNGSDTGASTTSPTSDAPSTSATSATTPATTEPADTTTPSTSAAPAFESDPFTLGVASGDPVADSVILWTRLAPTGALPDTDVEVAWEIARDAEMNDVVADGTPAHRAARLGRRHCV